MIKKKLLYFILTLFCICSATAHTKKVCLWGNLDTQTDLVQTIALMKKANIDVVAIITSGKNHTFFEYVKKGWKTGGKRKIKSAFLGAMRYFKSDKTAFNNIPLIDKEEIPSDMAVVCTLLGTPQVDAFLEAMHFCKKKNIRFLHPAFALTEIKFPAPLTPKVKVYGFRDQVICWYNNLLWTIFPNVSCLQKKFFMRILGLIIIISSATWLNLA